MEIRRHLEMDVNGNIWDVCNTARAVLKIDNNHFCPHKFENSA